MKILVLLFVLVLSAVATATDVQIDRIHPLESPKTIKKEKLALYEVGIGGGFFNSPHYPGSDQKRSRGLFIPYVIYRGETFKADDEGVRGELANADRYRVELSISAGFPADSDDNVARQGMPDLDWIGEVGPKFTYFILDRPSFDKLDISLPIRVVFSTNFKKLSGQGFTFHPVLTYRKYNVFHPTLSVFVRYGTVFATEETMDYFYEVSPEFATTGRPVYDAKEGFLEGHIDLSMRWRPTPKLNLFAGYQTNFYDGATNAASPLLKQKQTHSIGVGIAWSFYESKRRAGEFM